MIERKYGYSLSELIDRLCIVQLKEIFIPDHREQYSKEIEDLVNDIQLLLPVCTSSRTIDAYMIRDIVVLTLYNRFIWENEENERRAKAEGDIDYEAAYKRLRLTHSLNNGVRNVAKNKIQKLVGGRMEHKNISLYPEHEQWRPSGY